MSQKIIILLIVVGLAACVPAKKFKELEQKNKSCNTQLDECKQKGEQLTVENTEMKAQLGKSTDKLNKLIKDSMARAGELNRLQNDYSGLNKQYNDLQESHEAILKGNAKETSRLMKQLQTTQDDLNKKEASLKETEKNLEEKKLKLDDMALEISKRDARLKELEGILFRKDSVVNALKNKVSSALLGFENEGLSVKVQNGKVYVSMEEKLMFKSGSTSVDVKGQEALKKLAKVLEQNKDISITIEGHTDNVPLKGGPIKDNWDLSVQRATSIVHIILDNSKVDPKRLTASGRGEFSPVTDNKSSDSRAKNRRTEIILTPKLDELFKILESN